MKRVMLLCGATAFFLAGCASEGRFQTEAIPYPQATPVNGNEFARMAYLEGFRLGYLAQTGRSRSDIQVLNGPYVLAREAGFYAGVAEARRRLEETP